MTLLIGLGVLALAIAVVFVVPTTGVTSANEAQIIGYNTRRSSQQVSIVVEFQFTPDGKDRPLRFEKVIHGSLRLPPGSKATIRYSAKFPFLSVLVPYGSAQEVNSWALNQDPM